MLKISAQFKYKGSNNDFKLDSNLTTHSSGVTAIFGPSGSGKSTLFKIIAGLLKASSVNIRLNNETIYDSNQNRWSPPNERRIGYVFQDTRLFPHLNVKDNLKFAIKFNRNTRIRDLSFENIVNILNLEDLLNKNINHLSGGEKQLLSIGRALMANPNILLLDEPLGALDYERKKIIIPYLEKLCLDCKIPILYISHNISEIKSFANWVAIMKKGEISSFGPLEVMADQIDISLINEGKKTKTMLDSTIFRHDKINKLSILNIGKQNLTIPIVNNALGSNIKVQIKPQDVGISLIYPENVSFLNILKGKINLIINNSNNHYTDLKINIGEDKKPIYIWSQITKVAEKKLKVKNGNNVFLLIKTMSLEGNVTRVKKIIDSH